MVRISFSLNVDHSKDEISGANKRYHNLLRDLCQTNYDEIYNQVNEYVSDKESIREEVLNTFGEKETLLSVAESSNSTQTQKIDETVTIKW